MDKIHASFVLEILGRPKEKVEEALQILVKRIGEEKGIKMIVQKLNEPIPVGASSSLFTSFAEVELEFESMELLIAALFAYLPSHIKIFKPEKLTLTNSSLAEIASAIVQRLHNYDAITKKTIGDKEFVLQRLKAVAPEEYKRITAPPEEKDK